MIVPIYSIFVNDLAPYTFLMKVAVVVGTRPEAIKMAPVYQALRAQPGLEALLISTGQHREMLDQALEAFGLTPDIRLDSMRPGQDLATLTARMISGLGETFAREKPDVVLAHGDTASGFAAGLAGFYGRIPVAHVEAGLRTGDLASPFPEEFHRRSMAALASFHFAPTADAAANLVSEGVPQARIAVTGSTAVDALKAALTRPAGLVRRGPLVLVSAHRRENLGAPLRSVTEALRTLAGAFPGVTFLCCAHPNPEVRRVLLQQLEGAPLNLVVREPMGYVAFVHAMAACRLILTDSGGIQEEAAYLRKPLLLIRDRTERPEAVRSGAVRLVGTSAEAVVHAAAAVLRTPEATFAGVDELTFGDGNASLRIAERVVRGIA
jgi:UDP-N-acetylglucosamine 2-epimerase (non-hydrolysing)